MTKRLELIFQNAAGKRTTIAVVDPKEGLTPAEAQAAANTILTKNIFTSSGGDLTAILEARIVTRDVTEVFTTG